MNSGTKQIKRQNWLLVIIALLVAWNGCEQWIIRSGLGEVARQRGRQWEYIVAMPATPVEMQAKLKVLGSQGWELVAVKPADVGRGYDLIFKRRTATLELQEKAW